MKTALSIDARRSWFALMVTTAFPWLIWLDFNAMALRFVQLRGHWPMCPTALSCRPTSFISNDSIKEMWNDPLFRLLDPANWLILVLLISVPVWMVIWFTGGRRLPRPARFGFLIAFLCGWALLIFDPTYAFLWMRD